MTLDEMKAAADRLSHIKAAQVRLDDAQNKLRLINEHGAGKSWDVRLRLKEADRYGNGEIVATIAVPFGVVQQQAVYEVLRWRREVNRLGGCA